MARGTSQKTAPRRAPGRPRGGGLDLTADDLLDAAEKLIASNGPDVTMADLAAASEITKPSLYRIIGDRRALVSALARRFGDRVNDAVAVDLGSDPDAPTPFHTILRAYLRTVEERRELFLFISTDPMGDDRIDNALDIAGVSAEPLALTLRRAGASPSDARAWAFAIVGAAQFATFRWLRDGDRSATEAADQLGDLLWSGIDAAVDDRRPDQEEKSHVI